MDTTEYPPYNLVSTARQTGVKQFNLAFIVADGGGCTPEGGGTTAIGDNPVAAQIGALRAFGGDVRISFGGRAGDELALTCATAAQLRAAYQQVISAYDGHEVDFDIEGAALGNTAANALRDQALAALQHQDNGLQISFTVPVIPSGLSSDTVAMLAGAAWSTIAVTPMIGVNDVIDEVFALANARQLVAFAVSKHLAWLSMWSATRDTRCSGGSRLAAQPMCSSIAQSPGAFATALGAYRAGGYGR